ALARPASFATLFSLHAPPTPAISPLSLHDALPISSDAACYLQGVNESTHGIADSLLSIAAHRAADITADILAHRAAAGDGRPLAARGAQSRRRCTTTTAGSGWPTRPTARCRPRSTTGTVTWWARRPPAGTSGAARGPAPATPTGYVAWPTAWGSSAVTSSPAAAPAAPPSWRPGGSACPSVASGTAPTPPLVCPIWGKC